MSALTAPRPQAVSAAEEVAGDPHGRRPFRLWLLTLNYAPEPSGFAPHATALAEYLAGRGHDVTVVTGFPFAPRWTRLAEDRGKIATRTANNGVRLNRVSHFIPRRPGSAWQRLAMEATFGTAATLALAGELLRTRRRPEAVLYVGAQPAIAMAARLISQSMRVPYLVNINDLAAQAAGDVGIVANRRLRNALERFEYAAYGHASRASVLCRSFGDALTARGYPAANVRVIRSPVDLQQIKPLPSLPQHRRALNLPDDAFVVLFAGSMGLKQGLGNLINAALRLRIDRGAPRIHWALVGDGETRRELEDLISRHHLDEVHLLPFQPPHLIASMLAAADVFVLNQLATVKDTVVPSKLLTYMAAGRPVIAAVNPSSQGAEILRESNGGLLVEPENPERLAAAVRTLTTTNPNVLQEMGRRNREYAEEHFDQLKILAAHEQLILESLQS